MKKGKVLIIDTSILCVYLGVPGKDTCGSDKNKRDKKRADKLLQKEEKESTTFVLPLAVIIETGNHIAQASSKRYEMAQALAEIMEKVADEKTPWTAFTHQSKLWEAEGLKKLAEEWPKLAVQKISIGDATIKAVAEYYGKLGSQVEILTGDGGLKSYEPAPPLSRLKRRRSG
ncbi:type II toxin-antitoxin system VapC family toxin [Allocoleopsis sp.]|uniref:type II toxin-antitoxin system VapC family toxin n=1 Tax=Allocoleopsis sp. TaxID=3088169 RepID=UPI002FD4ABAB